MPRSRLVLRAPLGQARDIVVLKLEQQGVAASRVEFVGQEPRLRYFELFERIDLCLDPFPYNGHTTSLDAFWMGVPTITLVGTTVAGRAGLSQLRNLGLQELAAETLDQYVALAARLAGDLTRLQELRATLRERMRRSPLMDAGRFARNMEHAYREMWRRWRRQTEPAEQGAAITAGQPTTVQSHVAAKTSVLPALDTAWKQYQAGQLGQAERLCLEIVQMDSNSVSAWQLLGVIAGQTGRDNLAIDYYQRVVRLKPDVAEAHFNLGNIFLARGSLAESVGSFEQATRLMPNFASAPFNLGIALWRQGRFDEAVASYRRSLQIEPNHAGAHLNLCQ